MSFVRAKLDFFNLILYVFSMKTKQINKEITKILKDNNLTDIEIYFNEYLTSLDDILKNYAPSGSIAFITDIKSYNTDLLKHVKKLNRKIYTIFLEEKNTYEYNDFLELFNLPIDTRVVISFNPNLFEPCLFFCEIRNAYAIFIPNGIDFKTAFYKKASFFLTSSINRVNIFIKRFIILDERVLNFKNLTNKNLLRHILCGLFSFIDYKIYITYFNKILSDKINNNFYGILDKLSNFNINDIEKEELFSYLLKINLYNYIFCGDLFLHSSLFSALVNVKGDKDRFINKLIKAELYFYEKYLFSEFNTKIYVVDYEKRIDYLSKLFGLSKSYITHGLYFQLKSLENKKADFSYLIKDYNAVKIICAKNRITAKDKKGENFDDIKMRLLCSGDLIDTFNGYSVIRDKWHLDI